MKDILAGLSDFSTYNKRKRKAGQGGLGLQELIKSKEFKQRVALVKAGSRQSIKLARLAILKIGAYLKNRKGGKK